MYKVQLAVACLVATAQAIDLRQTDNFKHPKSKYLSQIGLKQDSAEEVTEHLEDHVDGLADETIDYIDGVMDEVKAEIK